MISVAHEEGDLNDLRAILGNDVAINAYREGKLPFQDGTIIAELAWSYVPLEESTKAFGRLQSFVAGPPKNGVQFMVKELRKRLDRRLGFAQFNDGKLADEAVHNTLLFLARGRQSLATLSSTVTHLNRIEQALRGSQSKGDASLRKKYQTSRLKGKVIRWTLAFNKSDFRFR